MFTSLAGVLANGACLLLLRRHRAGDINMSSVYECSRNDIAANLSVMIAALGVRVFGAGWPSHIAGCTAAALRCACHPRGVERTRPPPACHGRPLTIQQCKRWFAMSCPGRGLHQASGRF